MVRVYWARFAPNWYRFVICRPIRSIFIWRAEDFIGIPSNIHFDCMHWLCRQVVVLFIPLIYSTWQLNVFTEARKDIQIPFHLKCKYFEREERTSQSFTNDLLIWILFCSNSERCTKEANVCLCFGMNAEWIVGICEHFQF